MRSYSFVDELVERLECFSTVLDCTSNQIERIISICVRAQSMDQTGSPIRVVIELSQVPKKSEEFFWSTSNVSYRIVRLLFDRRYEAS